MANTKKAYVKIQSSITITVTMGLNNKDVTNPDAHVADRLKVSALWPKCTVQILAGAHWYPAEIAEWNTVKALEKDKILTIGEYSDACVDEPEVQKTKEELLINMKECSLDEIAGE